MGRNWWHNCDCTYEWRPDGSSLWPDTRERLLYGDLGLAGRIGIFYALRRRSVLLVYSTEWEVWPRRRILHGLSECVRLAPLGLIDEFHARQ